MSSTKRTCTAARYATFRITYPSVPGHSLPVLRQQSKDSNKKIAELLDSLPPPPSENPSAELIRLITAFSGEVENVIQGRESHERLIQICRPAYVTFKKDIRATAPQFRPFVHEGQGPLPSSQGYFEIDGSDETLIDEDIELPPPLYLEDVKNHIEKYVGCEYKLTCS